MIKTNNIVHRKQFTEVVDWIANYANKLTGWPSLGICTSVCLDWVTRMLFPHTLTLSKWAIAAKDIKHWRIQHTTLDIISLFSWEKKFSSKGTLMNFLFLQFLTLKLFLKSYMYSKSLTFIIRFETHFQKYLHDYVCVILGFYKTYSNEILFLLCYGQVSVEN